MIDLSPPHLEIVKQILSRHIPQHTVWVFGSRVGGKVKPHSDLDLAVLGDSPLEIQVLGGLREAFEESDLPMRVDIVDWAAITDEFRSIITQRHDVIQSSKR
jgi:predicted nucleotidyltransferase